MALDKNFDFESNEREIYKFWLENNFFHADENSSKKSFTIMMPPPNITGNLHMGHALDCTIQDIIARWKRMQGYEVLWLPGTDHASISTEVKLIKKLEANGIKKKNLTREKFLEHALSWKDEYQNNIIRQIKYLGCSCDWERLSFTMDEKVTRAVYRVFVDLYKKGMIYKGNRLVNWCTKCKTVISDAEVEHKDCDGFLWHIKYKIKDEDGFLEFATTRPETLLGDTAIAVNPNDMRYKNLIGKYVIVPFVNREIEIICDEYVDMEYGTGVVKITPAHDFNDFEVGKRHNLDFINIFDDDGKLNENAGEFCGLGEKEAREKILLELKNLGLFVREEKISHAIGFHDRCGNIIEPMLKPQWFVKMDELVKPAIKVFKEDKELKFWPERFGKIYLNWLENLNDWCISRQLWWGHRIPAYYCQDCGFIEVSEEKINICKKCGSREILQDEDVLDTWFSSALWPFATLGWPSETKDYNYFYPTDVLITSYDIIFFWVIRMVVSGLENTKKLPFRDVLIHGLIRDENGKKMSKSLDNGIDPIEAIKKYGADVLRMSLILGSSPGNDLRFYWDKLEANKNFINKLWNAGKFIIINLEKIDSEYKNKDLDLDLKKLELEDKWILKRLNDLIREVNYNLENYEHGIALEKIINFIWNELCDWYIEFCKIKFLSEKKYCFYVLRHVFIKSLKLLCIFMPFVSERLFLSLCDKEKSLMISRWVEWNKEFDFDCEEKEIEKIKIGIKSIRNARAEKNIHPGKKTKAYLVGKNRDLKEIFMKCGKDFLLCGIDEIICCDDENSRFKEKNYLGVIVFDLVFYLRLDDLLDINAERERLIKEKQKIEKEIERAKNKLNNSEFIKNAPEEIINKERKKLDDYKKIFGKIIEQEKKLK